MGAGNGPNLAPNSRAPREGQPERVADPARASAEAHRFDLTKLDLGKALKDLGDLFKPHDRDNDLLSAPLTEVRGHRSEKPALQASHPHPHHLNHQRHDSSQAEPAAAPGFWQRTWQAALERGTELVGSASQTGRDFSRWLGEKRQEIEGSVRETLAAAEQFFKPLTEWVNSVRTTCERWIGEGLRAAQEFARDPIGSIRGAIDGIGEALGSAIDSVLKLGKSEHAPESTPRQFKLSEQIEFPRLSSSTPVAPAALFVAESHHGILEEMAESFEHYKKRFGELLAEFTEALEAKAEEVKRKEREEEELDRRTFLGGDVVQLAEKLREISSAHPSLTIALGSMARELEGRGLIPREWVCQFEIDGILASLNPKEARAAA